MPLLGNADVIGLARIEDEMHRRRIVVLFVCLLLPFLIAAQKVADRFQTRINAANAAFDAAVGKAENARFYAVQKAATDRSKALKSILADATKAGDFDQATKIKDLIQEIETNSAIPERPKDIVTFKGHDYALITTPLTWHLAAKYCEQMGGHLVCFADESEQEFVSKLLDSQNLNIGVSIGATDEAEEGKWMWVTGGRVDAKLSSQWELDNGLRVSHWLLYSPDIKKYTDQVSGFKTPFVCEWDK